MILTLSDRQSILIILPKNGSIADQLICKEIREKIINLSDEYKSIINFITHENGSITYDKSKDEGIEFNFSESEKHVLKRGVDALDKSESVTLDILDICKEIQLL